LLSRIELNPDELDLPTPYVIKLMEVLMAADSRDTGNFLQLMRAEKQGEENSSPVSNHNTEPDRHMKKEEIKDNKNFLKLLDQIKSAVEEIEKTEDSD